MSEVLERMRWFEDQMRELVNDLDWLDEPAGLQDGGDNDVPDVPVKGLADG